MNIDKCRNKYEVFRKHKIYEGLRNTKRLSTKFFVDKKRAVEVAEMPEWATKKPGLRPGLRSCGIAIRHPAYSMKPARTTQGLP